MKLIAGGIKDEAITSLYNANQILCVIDNTVSIADSIFAICYVTKSEFVHNAREVWNFMQKKYRKTVSKLD